MADNCGVTLGDPAITLVDQGWNTFSLYASDSYQIAKDQIKALSTFTVPAYDFNVSFSDTDALTGYVRPTAPDPMDPAVLKFSPAGDPGLAPTTTLSPISFISPPVAGYGLTPTLDIGPSPGAFSVPDPGAAPSIAAITVPTAPVISTPATPSLLGINLPTAPTVVIPDFTAIAPVTTFDVPAQTWNFTPAAFSDALLDQVKTQITTVINTGLALPAAIQQALFDRAVSQDDASSLRAKQDAREMFGKLGFSEPDGVLDGRMLEITQKSQDVRGNLARDIYISNAQMQNKNIMDAVTQGVQLETQLMTYQIRMQELLLESNKFLLQTSIELFNARVSLFNAQVNAYGIDAQVYRDRIQAQLAKVEVYKSQIDAQRLVGEINRQTIAIYEATVRTSLVMAQIYEAQVRGAVAQAEVNRSIIEAYRAQVEAFGARVNAYTAQWQGFRAQVDAQVAKGTFYETSVRAYGEQVNAWAASNNNTIEQQKLYISEADLNLRGWNGELQRYVANVGAERDRIQANVAVYGANIEKYRADSSIEATASESNNRQFALNLARSQAQVDTALKNVSAHIEEVKANYGIIVTAVEGASRAASQLAAAAFSAVHFSASASSGVTHGTSCGTNFAYSGEISTPA
jgi:hypothetical protein